MSIKEVTDKYIKLKFNYLENKQGIILKVIHTSDFVKFIVDAKEMSCHCSINTGNYSADIISKKTGHNYLPFLTLFCILVFSIIPISSSIKLINSLRMNSTIDNMISQIISIVSMFLNILLIFIPRCIKNIKKEYKLDIPKSLR